MSLLFIFCFGLLLGSFFNVVVYRLPIMLQQQWQNSENKIQRLNLFFPRSHCPNCKSKIAILNNIPVLSYLLLKGKCKFCLNKINIRYPLLEILTAIVSVIIVQYYGFNVQAAAALIFSWSLLLLAYIDYETFLLPDVITQSLLWLGLLFNTLGLFADLHDAIIGAITGYLSLWVVAKTFQKITGKMGMANGDFKLLAALGAWMGWQLLLFIVLFASLLGTVINLTLILLKKQKYHEIISFGPYLAFVGWVAFMWGKQWQII